MGIVTGQFSRPAKFSTIIADADLDIEGKDIITTNLSLIQDGANNWRIKNRAKTTDKSLICDSVRGITTLRTNVFAEELVDAGVSVDGLWVKDDKIHELDGIGGEVMPKIVSDNLRNSHDAEVDTGTTGAAYTKVKTMTFTYGIKGTLRVKFDYKSNNGTYVVYGAVYKNGVLIGTPDSGNHTVYQTFSEDIAVGTIASGETLEFWGKAEHASAHILVENFRCYYDDDSGTSVVVTS